MAIDPRDLELNERNEQFLERLAEETGRSLSEVLNDVLGTAAMSFDQLREAVGAGIDELDRGLGEPLDIAAIKRELQEEFDPSGDTT